MAEHIDPSLFPAFRPLLEQLQHYGRLSGARFRAKSFTEETFDKESTTDDSDVQERLHAKLSSLQDVKEFAARLRAQEPALMEEYHRASRVVMQESVRKAIMATLMELELWPADDSEFDVEDIGWEDMSVNIRVIARRSYNYERMVSTDPLYKDRHMLHTTGSFLVDFGTDALQDNHPQALSQDSTSQSIMKDFIDVVKRYEQATRLSEPRMLKVQKAFLDALTQHGRWPEWLVRGDVVRQWFDMNVAAVVVGGVAAACLVGLTAYALSRGRG